MKHIHVTCGIVERDGRVLAARRSASMAMPLKWEFPGGKIHEGESPEECLRRELREELAIRVAVGERLPPCTYQYPSFLITLYPFVCKIAEGDIALHEHAEVAWLAAEELPTLDWAEADVPVLRSYLKMRVEGAVSSANAGI